MLDTTKNTKQVRPYQTSSVRQEMAPNVHYYYYYYYYYYYVYYRYY